MPIQTRRDGPPKHIAVYRPPPVQEQRDEAARARKRFYDSAAWRRCRALKLSQQPLCEACQSRGFHTPATQVHHVLDLADRKDLAFTLGNLQCLCVKCHSRETMRRTFQRRNSGDDTAAAS